MSHNFALIGAGGYVAPRHLKAIHDTGNRLVAAVDPHDAVGILDRYSFEAKYFREIERFDRHLEKLRRGPAEYRVGYVSICSPNFLHDAHVRLALRSGATAICEKPLVINPWNLEQLEQIEQETGGRVFTVLQLRLHPALIALRKGLANEGAGIRRQVVLSYVTSRGPWYHVSWKGDAERSGGLATNIGIHFFDLLIWLFGTDQKVELHVDEKTRMAGFVELDRADVRWFLSVDIRDLPPEVRAQRRTTFRSMTIDGWEVEFSDGFADLHTRVYEETLGGRGFGIRDARPSIELVHRIRQAKKQLEPEHHHPLVVVSGNGMT